jgi:hypothetical protein
MASGLLATAIDLRDLVDSLNDDTCATLEQPTDYVRLIPSPPRPGPSGSGHHP